MRDGQGEGDYALTIDAATIAIVSAAICVASDRLALMTIFVPLVLAARFAAWSWARPGSLRVEVVFFLICTGLGAFNDWNSVVYHRIYDYDAPAWFPALTTIPEWMLLYWGMILRFFATLAHGSRLGESERFRDSVQLGAVTIHSGWLRTAVQLAIVIVTRQLIYRFYMDPILSWLPFALAMVIYALLLRPDAHDRKLILLFLVGGPLIEILYIQVGGLHHYHLGWIGGVPLWIALWWVLAILIWKDLSRWMLATIGRWAG